MRIFLSTAFSGARQLSKPTGVCFSLRGVRHLMSTVLMSTAASPIVELREYEFHPEHSAAYVQATAKAAELRKLLVPLRFFSLPDTGGQLNIATHAYHYAGGLVERDAKRGEMGKSSEWKRYLTECRTYIKSQCSSIFVEAPLVNTVEGVTGLADVGTGAGNDCILEIRRYKLILGYNTVPKFLSLYGAGLSSKLNAQGTDPTTSLVTVMYSEVGRLNEVLRNLASRGWCRGNGTIKSCRQGSTGMAIGNLRDCGPRCRLYLHHSETYVVLSTPMN